MYSSTIQARPHVEAIKPLRVAQLPRFGQMALHASIVALCFIWVTPVVSLFITSFRPESRSSLSGWWAVFARPEFTLENYRDAFQQIGIGQSVINSLAVAIPATLGTVLISALGAFVLAHMRFRGSLTLFLALVAFQVMPPQVTLVPLLKLFNITGLTGTFIPIWIFEMGFMVPFGIFLLRGFFASIPSELIEAARIDGASELRIFTQIMMPLSGAALTSLGILQFLAAWNHLLAPLIFLGGSGGLTPLTVHVASLAQANGAGINTLTAATFISVIVPLIIITSMQKYFVRGILGGAVKG